MSLSVRISIIVLALAMLSLAVSAQDQPGTKTYKAAQKAFEKKKWDKSAALYGEAAQAGNTDAWYAVAFFYEDGYYGYTKDWKKAAECWVKAAENPSGENHLDAMYALAWRYAHAWMGFPKDMEKALYWYKRAAAAGHVKSMYDLGREYESGMNVEKDAALSAMFMKQAAVARYTDAMYFLGVSYLDGRIVPKDTPAARYWLQLAANTGDNNAQNAIRRLNGQEEVYERNDYRYHDQQAKRAREHPERQLTKADLYGGGVSQAEIDAYNKWWNQTHSQMYAPSRTTTTTTPSQSNADQRAHEDRMQKFYSDWDKERRQGKF